VRAGPWSTSRRITPSSATFGGVEMASNSECSRLPALAAMASKVSSVTTCSYFKPAARAAGLAATLRFYDLRHTAASLLIREAPASRRCSASSATRPPASPWTPTGACSPTSWTLPGRLEDLHGRALAARRAAEVWPHGGPAVVAFGKRAGQ
jgi:hypothetical protein